MRESFYIELERREKVQREWESIDEVSSVSEDDKFIGSFESQDFPARECVPIIRKRSRAAVQGMTNR